MNIFVATYQYSASPAELSKLRPERYKYFEQIQSQGNLLASGQLVTGELGDGLLIIKASSQKEAYRLLEDDPFKREGYVSRLDIAAWNPTMGDWVQ